jgi:glutamate--cysteine ligase
MENMNRHKEQRYDANRDLIIAYLSAGEGAPEKRRLGFELEHFIVEKDSKTAIPYHNWTAENGVIKPGIGAILTKLAPYYEHTIYQPQTDGSEELLGLERDRATITLEPGAQLEVSIGPAISVAEIEEIYLSFRTELDSVLAPWDYEVALLGYHPTARANDIALLPKARYQMMDRYFAQTGHQGICMMRGSASTQISIDYENESDALRKLRVASLLGPLFAFVTDNTPVFEGNPIGILAKTSGTSLNVATDEIPVPYRMARTAMWEDVDSDRSGITSAAFSSLSVYRAYATEILDAPAILTMEPQATFQSFKLIRDIYEDRILDVADITHLLSMFFFDIRLKQYVEIRVADALPPHLAFAYAALIEGLFYVPANLFLLDAMLTGNSASDIVAAKHALTKDGYEAVVYGKSAAQWLDELISLADTEMNPDRSYLAPLHLLIAARQTPLNHYQTNHLIDSSDRKISR